MAGERERAIIREAVAVFDNTATLQDAIDELMSSGFDRAEVSLLAAEKVIDEKLGHKSQKITELEDDPIVPRCCYISTESIGDAQGGLSRDQKIEILRRWEYHASENCVAVEEGMPDGESDLLRRILLALHQLSASVDVEQVGPTKQHGISRTAVKFG
jgi:hypothetical protein